MQRYRTLPDHPVLRFLVVIVRMLGVSAGLLVLLNQPDNAPMIAVVLRQPWIYVGCLVFDGMCIFQQYSRNLRGSS